MNRMGPQGPMGRSLGPQGSLSNPEALKPCSLGVPGDLAEGA